MSEENQIISSDQNNTGIKSVLLNNKKLIIIFFTIILIILFSYFFYNDYKKDIKLQISEKYNLALINYNKNNSPTSTSVMKNLIMARDATYSPLALYFIIDNEIITDTNKINKYFDLIIGINFIDKEIKNLNIYKKAIFNSNFATENELIKILRPILNSDSIWKSHSLLLLSDFFFFKNNKSESKKLLNEIIDNEKSNENIKLEAQKKLIRDFSD